LSSTGYLLLHRRNYQKAAPARGLPTGRPQRYFNRRPSVCGWNHSSEGSWRAKRRAASSPSHSRQAERVPLENEPNDDFQTCLAGPFCTTSLYYGDQTNWI